PQTEPAARVHPSFSKSSLPPPPRVLCTRGSVKDVPGHFVKDVMRLNTYEPNMGHASVLHFHLL
ncbi:MAG TPA: hypothetical protein VKR82_16640, partial [Candidatus Acidoferrales bacterium]|nr:hypothetical protein [Candidatus Acidoferrales bacterium]